LPSTAVDDPSSASAGRRGRFPVLAGVAALVVVVLLGAATAVFVLTRADSGADPGPAAAAPAPPFPTSPMLIRVDTGADDEPERRTNVFVLTPGQAGRRQITSSDSDVLPKWSHDRKRIALTRLGADINTAYVLNADGSGLTKIADGVTGGRMTWSMDDRRLAFVRQVDGVNQIFVAEPGGSAPVQLTRSADEKDDPTWLADGRHITYWVKHDGARQIYALDVADPREPGRLIAGPDAGPVNDPAPSPDGKFVLYTRETGPGTSDIWMIGTDGSNPHRVIGHPERDMDPAWSPDGSWFAFVRGELNRPTIVVARVDGTGETTLTTGNAREGHPNWY
jgi:Tol biopolymer transport system component